jgi:hypothetical protein
MKNIVSFVESLGGLHDCTVLQIDWHPDRQRMEIAVDDIQWNYEGLPEYPGPQKATFILSGVTSMRGAIPPSNSIISDWLLQETPIGVSSRIVFRCGIEIHVLCQVIDCIKDDQGKR